MNYGEGSSDFEKFVRLKQPLVMKNVDIGECRERWKDIRYLNEKLGDRTISIHTSTTNKLIFTTRNFEFQCPKFNQLLNYENFYFRSIGTKPRKRPSNFFDEFSEISDDFTVLKEFELVRENLFSSVLRLSSMNLNLWIHYDVMDNILVQINGRKKVTLWNPLDVKNLYIESTSSSSPINGNEDLYPKYKRSSPIEFTLEPGEVLYIPALWPHKVEPFHSDENLLNPFSVAVNLFWKDPNVKQYYPPKDLYGNKDFKPEDISKLPEYYQKFYNLKYS